MKTLDEVLTPKIIDLSLLSLNDIARKMLKNHTDNTYYTGITIDKFKVACDAVDRLLVKEINDIELAMCFISSTTELDLISAKNKRRLFKNTFKNSFVGNSQYEH